MHSSILAWEIPCTQEPGGLRSRGSQRVGFDRATERVHTCTHTQPRWKRSLDAERQGRFLKCSPLGRQGCDLGCVNTALQSTLSGKSGQKVKILFQPKGTESQLSRDT